MSKKVKRDWIWITPSPKSPVTLTKRQKQVLGLIASGYRTKEIAFEIGLKSETINAHVISIRKKLNAKSNAHAIFLIDRTILDGFIFYKGFKYGK